MGQGRSKFTIRAGVCSFPYSSSFASNRTFKIRVYTKEQRSDFTSLNLATFKGGRPAQIFRVNFKIQFVGPRYRSIVPNLAFHTDADDAGYGYSRDEKHIHLYWKTTISFVGC